MELVNATRYFADLFYITGSHKCALFLGQLLYWNKHKGKLGRIAKTAKEWEVELQLTVSDVTVCHKICLELGFIKIESRKFKNITMSHYTVYEEVIINCCKMIEVRSITESKKLRASIIESRNNLESSLKEIESPVSKKVGVLITETITETITNTSSTEINSVMPLEIFNTSFLNQEAANRIEKNKGAAPKSKPIKELSPLDKLIAEKVKEIAERFKVWYKAHKKIVYPYKRHDFVNLTGMFRDLCNNNGYTPDKVVEDITKIVTNYKKLSTFNQNNFSLNLIATKYNVLLSEIDTYKEPVAKQNYNEPVPYVKAPPRQDTHNGNWLPLGMSRQQYIDLCIEVGREQILNGNEPEDYNPYEVTHSLHKSLINLTPDQVKTILNRYDVQ
jgi:hypothetical protein